MRQCVIGSVLAMLNRYFNSVFVEHNMEPLNIRSMRSSSIGVRNASFISLDLCGSRKRKFCFSKMFMHSSQICINSTRISL